MSVFVFFTKIAPKQEAILGVALIVIVVMIIVMVVSKCATLEVSHFKNALVEYICIGRFGEFWTVDFLSEPSSLQPRPFMTGIFHGQMIR